MNAIKASIIIPTKDKFTRLRAVLKALENQIDDSIEVIVVFDGNSEGVLEAFERTSFSYTPIKVVLAKNHGRSAARNRGIEKAKGEVIIFIDDDRIPEPRFVQKHLSLCNEKTVVLGGRREILLSENEIDTMFERLPLINCKEYFNSRAYGEKTALPQFITRLLLMESSVFQWLGFFTGNVSVPKRVLDEVGGFDENFRGWGHEDVELGYRLYRHGLKFKRDATVENYHLVHESNSVDKIEQSITNLKYILAKYKKSITLQIAIRGLLVKEYARKSGFV